jgi:hypothetical protein
MDKVIKRRAKSKRSSDTGELLQETLDRAVADLPVLFLEGRISKKLEQQGIKAPKGLSRQLTEHVLSGSLEPFVYPGVARGKHVTLTVSESDLEESIQGLKRFQQEQLHSFISSMAGDFAKKILRDLKSRLPNENSLQEADLLGFRERLHVRWGKPLGQLRMLLTMSREWCHNISVRESHRRQHKNKRLRKLLIRLLVRACQVTDEILCLLENGFADGAMARWRTLHEIAVVAAVIQQHGDAMAERYIDHQAVESKRAMDKYVACSIQLGYRPLSAYAQNKIVKAYDQAITKYGKNFRTDYGWASFHLKKEKPTFAHLEEAAGRAEMRAHYQMSNDNIHAGVKSMYVRLGLLRDYERLLAGRAVRVCLSEPVFDDLVIANMLTTLRDEIPRSFARADSQLVKDDRAIQRARKQPASKR